MFDYINYMYSVCTIAHYNKILCVITLILILCQNTEVVICFNIIDNLKTGSWT